MSSSAILREKHAVVFGAGGSVGAAVAKELAAEGAEVFLARSSIPFNFVLDDFPSQCVAVHME